MPLRDGQVRRLAGGTDTLPMLSAARRALKLLSGPIPVPRMGDSASRVISAQEALPGRAEPIPVAGKTARALSMRAEPAHCALPEKKKKPAGPRAGPRSGSARARRAALSPPPTSPSGSLYRIPPPSSPAPGRVGAQQGSLLSQCFSLFESLKTKQAKQGSLKESSVDI